MSYPPASPDQPVNPEPDTKKVKTLVDHKDFKDRLEDGRGAHGKAISEGQIDYKFWSLDQWDASTVQALQNEGRPALTFDRTRPIVQAVLGSQITQRFQATYLPRETSGSQPDMKMAESGSRVGKYIQGRGNFEQIETLAFQDTLVTGIGCIEMFSSFEDNPDGDIRISRVPFGSYLWDAASTEPAMLDNRWVVRGRWVDRKTAANLYGFEKMLANSDSKDDSVQRVSQTMPTWNLFGDGDVPSFDRTRDQVLLYNYQCFETHYQTRIMAPDIDRPELLVQAMQMGAVLPRVDALKAKAEAMDFYLDLQQRIEAMNMEMSGNTVGPIPYPVKIEDFPVRVFYDSIHTKTECLRSRVMKHPSFTYMFITAFEDWSEPGRRSFFGIVRPMRDPQKYANKFLSQAVHLFTANPKGALIAEADLFEDPAKAMNEYAKATGLLIAKPGALSNSPKPKFAQLTNNVSMRGIESLLGYAMSAVAASVGISESSFLGQAGDIRRVSGEALSSLISQQQKTQVLPFDSLRLYRKTMGRLMLSFIQNDMDEHLLQRILSSPDDQAFLQTYRDEALLDEYDVIVEEAPSSPNERQQVFQVLVESQILPQLLSNGIPIPPSLARFFPLQSQATGELERSLKLVYELQMASLQQQIMAIMHPQVAPPGGGEGNPSPDGEQQGQELPVQ